jgi:hypothetical protein
VYCRDCAFFKEWKSFGSAMCEVSFTSVGYLDQACKSFTPKGRFNEWGEQTPRGKVCR